MLAEIDQQVADPRKKLERFAAVFQSTIEAGNRMCPFGMLAADSETLESGSCEELKEAFDDLENWLRRVLLDGKKAGALAYAGSALHEARLILSTLEGACWWRELMKTPLASRRSRQHCLLVKLRK